MNKNILSRAFARADKRAVAKKLLTFSLTTALTGAAFANSAAAAPILLGNGTGNGGPLLANAVAGKLMLKADVGYVAVLDGNWTKAGDKNQGDNISPTTSAVGYGVSLGWTHKTGFGVSMDYMGFNNQWSGNGTGASAATQYKYNGNYNVVTFVPNYRLKLDKNDFWGARFGLGLGFSLSSVNWNNTSIVQNGVQTRGGLRVAGGASYSNASISGNTKLTPNATCGNTGGDNLIIVYYDSVGVPGSTLLPNQLRCTDSSVAAGKNVHDLAPSGLNDIDIANALNNGSIFYNLFSSPVSYTVWNHVNSQVRNAMIAGNATAQTLDQATAQCTGAGGVFNPVNGDCISTGGSGKGVGFIVAPQAAIEYDNGLLHCDVNIKYLQELVDVRYNGSEGSGDLISSLSSAGTITYTKKAGPLALFIGVGLGANF